MGIAALTHPTRYVLLPSFTRIGAQELNVLSHNRFAVHSAENKLSI